MTADTPPVPDSSVDLEKTDADESAPESYVTPHGVTLSVSDDGHAIATDPDGSVRTYEIDDAESADSICHAAHAVAVLLNL